MSELLEFVLARIDEDPDVVRATVRDEVDGMWISAAEGVTKFDHVGIGRLSNMDATITFLPYNDYRRLQLIADVYPDHPDYRERWPL